jgi:hypothetical protein
VSLEGCGIAAINQSKNTTDSQRVKPLVLPVKLLAPGPGSGLPSVLVRLQIARPIAIR